ncbi:UNVERIFIED_CONTAM: hypothetical protein ACS92_06870 [Bacillus cereus]
MQRVPAARRLWSGPQAVERRPCWTSSALETRFRVQMGAGLACFVTHPDQRVLQKLARQLNFPPPELERRI